MSWFDSHTTSSTVEELEESWESPDRWRNGGVDHTKDLAPLVHHLEQYDQLRGKFESEGAGMTELPSLTAFLHKKIVLTSTNGRKFELTLTNPQSVRTALVEIGGHDLHLAVRIRESKMPVYYLCRTRSCYWTDYTLILEDFYLSPGYPILDERFVQLMQYGHESFHLRLATLREATRAAFECHGKRERSGVDRILKLAGEVVFQSAWHEDQRLAFACARAFGILEFQQAIELLYLCLCADLCSLRNSVDPELTAFFRTVYKQPAIERFLAILPDLEGGEINELYERALKGYAELSKAFSKLLHVEVKWGRTGARLPIYKLVFANAARVDVVGDALKEDSATRSAAGKLNAKASEVIKEMTSR